MFRTKMGIQAFRMNLMRKLLLCLVLSFSFPDCSAWMLRSTFQRINSGALVLRKMVPTYNKSWAPAARHSQVPGSVHAKRLLPTQSVVSPDQHTILLPPSNDTTVDASNDTTAQLLEKIRELEDENARLQYTLANRIVLETFEGEQYTPSAFSSISDEESSLWCDQLNDDDACPIEPTISFGTALKDRAAWLVGLLLLQSASGLILAHNEALLANHPVIIYYLTMLVGAGGNAGNQASVRVIRGLALGSLNEKTQNQFLLREVKMAGALSGILSLTGFLRTVLFHTPLPEAIAVTSALSLIVFSSVCFGAVLPLVLQRLRVDPAHSSTTIQVIMDILGVVLAVAVSSFILDSSVGHFLISRLT